MRPVTFYRCNFYGLQFVLALVPFEGSLNFLLNRGWEWVYLCMYGMGVTLGVCVCKYSYSHSYFFVQLYLRAESVRQLFEQVI